MQWKVPFVDYALQYKNLKRDIDEALQRVLSRGDLILRDDVEQFEKRMADFIGSRYAVGVNSCSDALRFSLLAVGVGSGDEVITVSHTFFATIEAIKHVGATPILIDVGDDFLMDVEELETHITKKTKAIIPVHLNGRVCAMDTIMRIAKRYRLMVIEDAAQALGAQFKNKKAGSFGVAGCFSFYPAKLLGGAGDGGVAVTNSKAVAEMLRLLRNHGQKSKEEIVLYGFTSRLHNIQAAILNVKFTHIPQWIKRRQVIARMYTKGLGNIPGVTLPPQPDRDYEDVYQNYVLRVRQRDNLFRYLQEKGVETLIKDRIPLHAHRAIGLSHFSLPYSEQLAKEIISLPIYPELTDRQVDYVIRSIRAFYQ